MQIEKSVRRRRLLMPNSDPRTDLVSLATQRVHSKDSEPTGFVMQLIIV